MASEAACLGTPAIYLDDTGRLYTNELQKKYGQVFNFSESDQDQGRAIEKSLEILKTTHKKYWQLQRKKLLNDKIDVTAFLGWFTEHWPQSFEIMKKNPEYQNRFE